ncbi:MAG: dihydrofolate reductase family protein [Williamsia sp.]|nr:dihydrofolate reductase family protein [Williamsia sp.]
MRKLILEEWISLDGYASDKNGQLDFFPATEANRYADEHQLRFLDTVDTVLLGRVTYELFVEYWPAATTNQEIIADKLNSLPKLVFSNTLKEAPWGRWPAASIVPGDAVQEISKLKKQPGGNMVLWGSISLAQLLMKENLIDEYHLQICPTTTGGGRQLFPERAGYTDFKLTDLRKYDTGLIYLQYEP